eukprot:NODE_125_length_18781_cov_0.243015.p12 type:complete len:104 gc:universal NODE_125_length_18781_cov_0.243015:17451-17762(+)
MILSTVILSVPELQAGNYGYVVEKHGELEATVNLESVERDSYNFKDHGIQLLDLEEDGDHGRILLNFLGDTDYLRALGVSQSNASKNKEMFLLKMKSGIFLLI